MATTKPTVARAMARPRTIQRDFRFAPTSWLRQAQILILELLQCMDACPAVFKRGGQNLRFAPFKVRDLRLDLEQKSSFVDEL